MLTLVASIGMRGVDLPRAFFSEFLNTWDRPHAGTLVPHRAIPEDLRPLDVSSQTKKGSNSLSAARCVLLPPAREKEVLVEALAAATQLRLAPPRQETRQQRPCRSGLWGSMTLRVTALAETSPVIIRRQRLTGWWHV